MGNFLWAYEQMKNGHDVRIDDWTKDRYLRIGILRSVRCIKEHIYGSWSVWWAIPEQIESTRWEVRNG